MSGWQWLGWNLVIFFAGMQGISQDINEAAIIDGASHTRIFFNITLPILKPIVLFTLVQATIGTFQLFTEPFMLRNGSAANGGPGYSGLTLMVYILQQAPQNLNFGYAAAMANVLCVMIIIVSLFITGIMGEKDEPKYRKRAEAV
jgi:ABC-type sugar transport system permease subunit